MSVSCIFFKILFINQDYIHCGLPINSLIRKKLSFFFEKKNILTILNGHYLHVRVLSSNFEARCHACNFKKKMINKKLCKSDFLIVNNKKTKQCEIDR